MNEVSEHSGRESRRHQVVIIGAGFGGLAAARALHRARVGVTVIDRTNHHLFQPLLYQVATGVLATTLKLCRLRYVGSASQWQFAIYRASHDDYDESVFFTGLPVGTCQDALDTACGLYLNDPTAWTRHPTNLRARPLS
jgi:choline dehydrogenase-like flavoprotein